jgi:hypothetical protein
MFVLDFTNLMMNILPRYLIFFLNGCNIRNLIEAHVINLGQQQVTITNMYWTCTNVSNL